MLSKAETISKFITPVTAFQQIGKLQKVLLKSAVTSSNDSLAAVRLLALLNDSDVSALLLDVIYPMSLSDISQSLRSQLSPLQTLIDSVEPYRKAIRLAVSESKDILPSATVEVLEEYDTNGSPLDQIAIVILIIMAATLKE